MAYTFKQALNSLPKVNGGPKPVITAPFTKPGTGLPVIGPAPAPKKATGNANAFAGAPVNRTVANNTGNGGGGGGYGVLGVQAPSAAEIARANAEAEVARKKAEDDAKRGRLRGEGNQYLDQLTALYKEMIDLIRKTGQDSTARINKSYDGKVSEQNDLMNDGMYQSDAANAANNLAGSSWMSFDRSKIRKAKEANVDVLDAKRGEDLATIGQMVSTDTARAQADLDGIDRSRRLLGETEDIGELQSTVNTLDSTRRGANATKAKYGTQGDFVNKANSLGNYDTSALEKSLASIVANASASPAAKSAAMDDLMRGTPLDDGKKKELKNKYSQVV